MYTFASAEGIDALKERESAHDDPWTMTIATWSDEGRKEFETLIRFATDDERTAILESILGGGDETSHEHHERVSFVMGEEAFNAMVDALVRAHDTGDEPTSYVAGNMLSSITETVGVDWV